MDGVVDEVMRVEDNVYKGFEVDEFLDKRWTTFALPEIHDKNFNNKNLKHYFCRMVRLSEKIGREWGENNQTF